MHTDQAADFWRWAAIWQRATILAGAEPTDIDIKIAAEELDDAYVRYLRRMKGEAHLSLVSGFNNLTADDVARMVRRSQKANTSGPGRVATEGPAEPIPLAPKSDAVPGASIIPLSDLYPFIRHMTGCPRSGDLREPYGNCGCGLDEVLAQAIDTRSAETPSARPEG